MFWRLSFDNIVDNFILWTNCCLWQGGGKNKNKTKINHFYFYFILPKVRVGSPVKKFIKNKRPHAITYWSTVESESLIKVCGQANWHHKVDYSIWMVEVSISWLDSRYIYRCFPCGVGAYCWTKPLFILECIFNGMTSLKDVAGSDQGNSEDQIAESSAIGMHG